MKNPFSLNPVALRELRQLVRSKIITVGLALFPGLLFVFTMLAVSNAMSDKPPEELAFGDGLGSGPFTTASMLTGIVAVLGIPFFAAICLEPPAPEVEPRRFGFSGSEMSYTHISEPSPAYRRLPSTHTAITFLCEPSTRRASPRTAPVRHGTSPANAAHSMAADANINVVFCFTPIPPLVLMSLDCNRSD